MMTEQTVQGVTIETSDRTLTITDLKQPVWYGDYHGGKLAIFHVQVNGAYSDEVITVVAIFTDAAGDDFVFSSDYDSTAGGFEEIASHICALVIIEYAKQKSVPASTYVPGTDTLQ
jgi:hypothetical protein